MRRQLPAAIVAAALLVLAAAPAAATTIRLHSLGDLAGAAGRVTHGIVVSSAVERDALGDIWTVYGFQVVEELKDAGLQPGATYEFRQFGGTLDGQTHVAVGFPHFRVGDELVLLLGETAGADDGWLILNAWQGALRVVEQPSLSGGPSIKLVPGLAGQFPGLEADGLDELKDALREAIAGGRP